MLFRTTALPGHHKFKQNKLILCQITKLLSSWRQQAGIINKTPIFKIEKYTYHLIHIFAFELRYKAQPLHSVQGIHVGSTLVGKTHKILLRVAFVTEWLLLCNAPLCRLFQWRHTEKLVAFHLIWTLICIPRISVKGQQLHSYDHSQWTNTMWNCNTAGKNQ